MMQPEAKPLSPTIPAVDGAIAEGPVVEGLAARAAALELVQAAVARRGGFDEGLGLPSFTRLTPRERAFARALAGALLRQLGPIDAALDAKLQTPPPEAARWLLRLGAAQILHMDVAAHAAVSITVDQASATNATRPYKGLINAVLRKLAREGAAAADVDTLAPPWLLARWRAAYGEATARAIAAEIAREPPTDLSLRAPADASLIVDLEATPTATGGLRTARKGELSEWPGYADGGWWVQDAAAALPARLLGLEPGQTALDLCAAPGGKTLQLAAAGARVVALDRSAGRLKRLRENLARSGLPAEVVVADAAKWVDPRQFDGVLLDAPCSATGTFRRHPDVLWAARPGDVATLCALQVRLLASATTRVRPGGRLVYCVCSLEPEEGEAQARAFLQAYPDYTIDPVRPGEGGAPGRAITPDGFVRLLPGAAEPELAGDGFFIARFRRAA